MHSCWTGNISLENGGKHHDLEKHTFRGVLETQITDSTEQFWLQEKIPEKS
jgi:hypothetical protein